MKSQYIRKKIAELPDSPGVYLFKRGSKILYIGKATSLCDRVASYFRDDILKTRGPVIVKMLRDFDNIDYIKNDSVLEALLLEANLIKKHQPQANAKEKDNKSFNFVVITREDFPRILIIRGRDLLNIKNNKNKLTSIYRSKSNLGNFRIGHTFGPFPHAGQLRVALKIIRKMFPYRDDKCTSCEDQIQKIKNRKLNKNKNPISFDISQDKKDLEENKKLCKPCFNRQIGLCPGVCTGEIAREEYAETIRNIVLFFEGNKRRLVKNLEKQMKSFAKNHEFENANITKRILFSLNHIQDVALLKEEAISSKEGFRIESYDIAHLSGTNVVGVMTVVENGESKKSDYRKFKIKEDPGINDTKALGEVLYRRLGHNEWPEADLIVVDGGLAQKRVMERILANCKMHIPVVSVVKDEYHRPKQILGDRKWLVHEREILLANSESHRFGITYHTKLRNKFLT